MPRHKKDAIRLSLKMERKIATQLDRYCYRTGLNRTKAIENIIVTYLQSDLPYKEEIADKNSNYSSDGYIRNEEITKND